MKKYMFDNEYKEMASITRWFLGKFLLWFIVLSILFGAIGYGCSWINEAQQVGQEQFGPRSALKKYEWFKDAFAQLEKKRADIKVYENRLNSALKRVEKGDRTDRERLSIIETELAGVIASYNSLAAEYNAASEKFNWSLFAGDNLPRSVVEYKGAQ